MESMESETRRVFKYLRASDATLATWEFKSLSVGSKEVMAAVLALDDYPWVTCDDRLCPKHHAKLRKTAKVAEDKLGHDAEHPP